MSPSELPASVQFYDNLSTISDMRVRRFSLRRIWQTLTDSGKYTGDYTHFCRLAKKEFGDHKEPQKPTHYQKPAAPHSRENTRPTTKASSAPGSTNDNEEEDDDGPLMFMDDISTKKKP